MAESNACGFPGYSVQKDLTLLPDLDENEDMLNPDLVCNVNIFCDICQGIVSKVQSLPDKLVLEGDEEAYGDILHVPFYESEDEIRRSVQRGCHLCTLFLVDEKYCTYPYPRQATTIPNGLKSWVALDRLLFRDFDMYQYRHDKLKSGKIAIYSSTNTGHTQPSAERLSASNASEHTFQLALSGLKTCLKDDQCQPAHLESHQMPKRLLYVGDMTSPQLRVMYPRTHVPYLTISHCWGGIEDLTLRSDTYNELTENFNDYKLPRLWRDCVNVTRRLGFKYLWIDSLCIRQDNPNDKAEEIKKMGDIYSGSVCNIAAVSALDCTASLFTKLVPLATISAYTKVCPSSKEQLFLPARGFIHTPTPLYNRAWVVQERVLAPRILEFSVQGITYSCARTTKGERNAGGLTNLSHVWTQLLGFNPQGISEDQKFIGQQLWMEIVFQYTNSALTREADRKDALAGVITVLSKSTGLSFSHGVCTTFLPYSLLWKMQEPRDLTVSRDPAKYPPYTEPSWSSTFRPESSSHGLHYWSNSIKDCLTSKCSLDKQTSVISIKSMHSGIRLIKSDPGPIKTNLREALRVQHLHGHWTGYNRHEIFDNAYHDTVEAVISMDYSGFDPIEVEFVLLIGASNPRHSIDCVAYGLVLTGNPDTDGLWKRVGIFRLVMRKAPKDIPDALEYIMSPFKGEKEFRIC